MSTANATVRRLTTGTITLALALGASACDGNAADDLENIEDNIDEGADEVGEVVEDAGEGLQNDDGEDG